MAQNGLKVLDSDMHGIEPADLWKRYLDDADKPFAPRGSPAYVSKRTSLRDNRARHYRIATD